MSKRLSDILNNVKVIRTQGSTEVDVVNITADSRKVDAGWAFVAVTGTQVDGHNFIEKAIVSGAKTVVCEILPSSINNDVTYIQVDNSAIALGVMASNFHHKPSSKLIMVGVTGTNGKTSTVTLLTQLFTQLGHKVGMLSTVENIINGVVIPSTHTTPDPVQLNELLARMVDEGCSYCFMEVSSHSIHQHRIAGLNFKVGLFTNISHDHLDYHKTFDEYIGAKKAFFDELSADSFSIVNIDDKRGQIMVQNTKSSVRTLSLKRVSDYKAKLISNTIEGLELEINNRPSWFRLVGEFNAYNLLGVFAIADVLGEDTDEVLRILSSLDTARGRFEKIVSDKRVMGIIDYAHTPDALDNVLNTINSLRIGQEKIITVVGCGGDRDVTKRPKMAEIACKKSDRVILTSDNPRSESPEKILSDMQVGVGANCIGKTLTITDRKEAIKTACSFANPMDVILLAGKGHENYQEIDGVKHHFDDKEVLVEMLKLTGK